ncbi:E2 ligase fold family C protein [Marivirga salinae]|uniref:E2 ligase fold family C protein n=1 Tax=Marivirga salinarum TaxID=3059078 RepID=A0AA51NB50_9BACT|nr:E2 ligase fold family C protein [Marivirga sp. BDSF4-3]WMN12112.1 E2 ligase fold family C protein [Marivirga sp. BDSF4-3]
MGFAKYFEKDLLALNKLMSSDSDRFIKEKLNNQLICLEFDDQYHSSYEAKCCLELLISIIARLYPRISFKCDLIGAEKTITKLSKYAKKINKEIDIENDKTPSIILSTCKKPKQLKGEIRFYLGSDNWTALFSTTRPQSFAFSKNPFGASIAACIAASNLFRSVFEKELKFTIDDNVRFSILDQYYGANFNIKTENLDLDEFDLVGIGAIGSATVWALSKLKGLKGRINLIDHEKLDKSNLQRYILFNETDENKWKVDVAKKHLNDNKFKPVSYKKKWANYIGEDYKGSCTSKMVLVAVDSKEERINIQSSLPQKIINAYTDDSRVGISRHLNFIEDSCLACIYIPTKEEKGDLTLMVESLNLKGQENFLYKYLQPSNKIDHEFIDKYSEKNDLEKNSLKEYIGKNLTDFYSEVICGYKVLELKDSKLVEKVDVPLSFQSALAGILLAAELVIEKSEFSRKQNFDVTQWQILAKINKENPGNFNYIKNLSKNCICGDSDYQDVYKKKWNI